eukprot:CAMPEP_0194417746 /NCGR_PEP_ID=MMETSP0176-20130528/16816_1 /TAXON_ID=216777 /ORGANISM="Proboscia alata, Strain PI-D3" /LENGTH=273 /DNA_ID=CAMNT_0039223787 /DNA_START=573 /DNA_END=1394 /DNA_ORIENTATION=-
MEPTIHNRNEIILVEKLSQYFVGLEGGPFVEERILNGRIRQQHDELMGEPWDKVPVASQPLDTQLKNPNNGLFSNVTIPTNWLLFQLYNLITTPIRNGDVIIAEHPYKNFTVCKRILGLPGDVVVLQQLRRDRNSQMQVVPDHHVWLEGDNSLNSIDSRDYGALPLDAIVGRVLLRLWPLFGGNSYADNGVRTNSSDDNESVPAAHEADQNRDSNKRVRSSAFLGRGQRPMPENNEMFTGSILLPAGYAKASDISYLQSTSSSSSPSSSLRKQ